MPTPDLFQPDAPAVDPDAIYVRVAVERGIEHARLNTPDGFTYREADDPLAVGDRVEAPLGRGGTPTAGVVIARGGAELLDGYDPAKVKPVTRRTGAGTTPELIELARRLADYYVCPLGMVLSTMTPAAVKKAVGTRTRKLLIRTDTEPAGKLTKTVAAALDAVRALPADAFPVEPADLKLRTEQKTMRALNQLIKLGVLEQTESQTVRTFGQDVRAAADTRAAPDPTDAQQHIIEGITKTLGTFTPHLIRGVTGSGKTEVYLRVMERALQRGSSALVLVPEIALTPQTSSRFLGRFADYGVAVLHSGLTSSQRHAEWRRVQSGEARVVVGARSAAFAPVSDLGLIVIDEEHDSSYKQDQLPRYHARTAAMMRAQLAGCPIVLGSATPSLESWAHARGGRIKLWELTERVGGGALPPVDIIDLEDERRAGMHETESIGPRLGEAIRATLTGNGQVLLLLNRRGFASHAVCSNRSCGWVLHCDHCDAAMVFHRANTSRGGYTRCHHCGAEQLMPKACPVDANPIVRLGWGTQRLEDELDAKFADIGVRTGDTALRVDADTMQRAADYFEALGRFERGEARLLFGTQMIAKGLDFPGVELVGVVSADTALAIPDYRAEERAFQLISQVAGRAGRAGRPARVLVQTRHPRAFSVMRAAEHDYLGFADKELEVRRRSPFPPAVRSARIVIRDRDEGKASARARTIADALREACADGQVVRGPEPCVIGRVADQYRFAVELVASDVRGIQSPLQELRRAGLVTSDAHTAVDVDPIAMV